MSRVRSGQHFWCWNDQSPLTLVFSIHTSPIGRCFLRLPRATLEAQSGPAAVVRPKVSGRYIELTTPPWCFRSAVTRNHLEETTTLDPDNAREYSSVSLESL